MTNKKILFLIIITFLVTSCTETFDSVKRGLTGAKRNSADEFLVKKKDPLILPPDYENLPTPDEQAAAKEDDESIKKKLLKSEELIEELIEVSSQESSTEESIIEQIRKR